MFRDIQYEIITSKLSSILVNNDQLPKTIVFIMFRTVLFDMMPNDTVTLKNNDVK